MNSLTLSDFPPPRTIATHPEYSPRISYVHPAALEYPGKRPDRSFCVIDDFVMPMQPLFKNSELTVVVTDQAGLPRNFDDIAEERGVAKLSERIPIVGFGSNANPSQLVHKYRLAECEGDKTVIPTLKGTIKDVAAAYVARPSMLGGYIPADLIHAPGSQTDVFVNLLSQQQLDLMMRSEGSSYVLCQYGTVRIDQTDLCLPAAMFLAEEGSLVDERGMPILIKGISDSDAFSSMSQEEVLRFVGQQIGDELSRYQANFEPMHHRGEDAEMIRWFFRQNAPVSLRSPQEIVYGGLYSWVQRKDVNRAREHRRRYAVRNAMSELLQTRGFVSKEWSLLPLVQPAERFEEADKNSPPKLKQLLQPS